ncbi:MAG: NADH:flavin oxidoreductase [Candidatus Bathyarchaeota archaeon]|nr:NADH:flavin oxidoreductase [Candidatus Bathyarchaeota archaeon]
MNLFDITSIKNLSISNRFVRSATWSGMATEEGYITPQLITLLENLADGGVGLIISGYAHVLKNGQSAFRQLGIYNDSFVDGLTDMVDAVHCAGGKIVAQIVHGGAHSNPQFTGEATMGPTAIPAQDGKTDSFPGCRAMTQHEINTVVDAFRRAAIRAKAAGFDGIQLHAAHGYLFSQFLSPFYNKRTDQYGGSILNRARIVIDTYNVIRQEVGTNYPILIKMNSTDFLDDGITQEDAVQAASLYAKIGIDAIELSGGTGWGSRILGDSNRSAVRIVKDEAYYRDMAQRLKQIMKTPIILTGGIKSYEVAADVIHNNVADYIGLCRPLIREPDLVNRWKSGDTRKATCISENACFVPARNGQGIRCVHENA